MVRKLIASLLATAGVIAQFALPARAAFTDWHTPPEDWKEPRIYETPFEQEFSGRIQLRKAENTASDAAARVLSPNGAYSFEITVPDTTRPGPWSTVIRISNETDHTLVLTLIDHGNALPTASWVNEKLIYVRSWWGRILGTDLVLDVEKETILYEEMIHSGEIVLQQAEEAKGKKAILAPVHQRAVSPAEPPVAASPGHAATPGPILSSAPALSVEAALGVADACLKEQKIDVSEQHIQSIRLLYDEQKKQSYWLIDWAWNRPRMGMEIEVRVYMDKTASARRLGP